MNEQLNSLLETMAETVQDAADRPVRVVSDNDARRIAADSGCSFSEIYLAALELGICPLRYLRNRETVSLGDQLKLARSRVGVVGAGGLGGHVILHLARVGVGFLRVVDGDVFDESNLNRQALADTTTVGKAKTDVAVQVVAAVNPAVTTEGHHREIDAANAGELLDGLDVVVDALDNVRDRFVLAEAACRVGVPLVHGAVAGLEGRVMTIFPEDKGLELLYGKAPRSKKDAGSPEAVLGTPPFSPAMIATLQAVEVLKILLQRGPLLRRTMAYVDLETGKMDAFRFGDGGPETRRKS